MYRLYVKAIEKVVQDSVKSDQLLLLSREDRVVFQRIYARLAGAEDLASAFQQEEWPMALSDVMSVIPQVTQDEKRMMISAVKDTIHIEHVHISRVLANAVSKAGFLMMLTAVIVAAVGFYVPLANMASNFG